MKATIKKPGLVLEDVDVFFDPEGYAGPEWQGSFSVPSEASGGLDTADECEMTLENGRVLTITIQQVSSRTGHPTTFSFEVASDEDRNAA